MCSSTNANSLVKIWDKVQIEECIYAYDLTAMGTMVIIRAMKLSDYCQAIVMLKERMAVSFEPILNSGEGMKARNSSCSI